MKLEVVGLIRFDGHVLDVYNDLDEPYFLAVEVAKLVDYSIGNTAEMLRVVEEDEKVLVNTRYSVTSNTNTDVTNMSRQERRALERKEAKASNRVGSTEVTGQRGNPNMWFVTELGLYNILSQSRKPIARKWRRVVHSNLIMMRRNNKLMIDGQFEEWDAIADDLYIDEDTGILMQSVTMPGGDVEQVPYAE